MGKIGFAFDVTKQIANFVKTCNKNSVLQTKFLFRPNLNEFIVLLKQQNGEKICRYIRNEKQIGEIRYVISKGNIGKYPDYYLDVVGKNKVTKPSVFISHLEAQGCGANLMKVAAKDAEKFTDGRMILDAQSVDGMTSPDAFYYKLGFRKLNQKENELIKEYIDKGEKIPPDTFSDRMYLPKEKLFHLLNYKKKY